MDPTALLEEKPVLRFETFGPVAKVVKEAELNVPEIFGKKGEEILTPLKAVIFKYAASQSWGEIFLSLSQNMAQRELDELLEREIGHEGPLVIDPSASTEEHQVYQSQTHAKLQKSRLIRANETTGDILTVLYGIDSSKRAVQTRLLTHRVRMAELALEEAEEQDASLRAKHGLSPLNPKTQRRLHRLRRRLKAAHSALGTEDEINEDVHGELFLALSTLVAMGSEADSHLVRNLVRQLGTMPEQFQEIGITYTPYQQTLPRAEAVNRPEEKPAVAANFPQLKR